MIYVEGGTFMMGATPEQEKWADNDEKPAHKVTLSSYYICKYLVTQKEWMTIMGKNPSKEVGEDKAVNYVSKVDCDEFVSLLKKWTGINFALPTEAQWEFAARGGNYSKGYVYSGGAPVMYDIAADAALKAAPILVTPAVGVTGETIIE